LKTKILHPPNPAQAALFFAAMAFVLTAYTVYGVNIVRWRNSPNYGWITMYDSGPNVVAEVFASGAEAGLRTGDRILAINGKPYSTFEELFLTSRKGTPGSINVYTVMRSDQTVEVRVPTGRLGMETVLRRSGPVFAIGLIYTLIGIVVFLMKPWDGESWVFLVMTSVLGMTVSFGAPSEIIRPFWFYHVRFFFDDLIPAPILHLALRFPKVHPIIARRPRGWIVMYLASAGIFLANRLLSTSLWDTPQGPILVSYIYLLAAVLAFLSCTAWYSLRDPSQMVRIQSRMIFVGLVLGLFIPLAEMLCRFLWGVYLFPNPSIAFATFLFLFPASIGYTIVKHDLFSIDVIVRRTTGYVLSTGAIVGVYSLVISLLNLVFRSAEAARSPLFSIGFALAAVFLFRPLHERIQAFVDRVFYRQRYDYRKTIKSVSEAMTSILDPKQIQRMLVGSVVSEMFLENGMLALEDRAGASYRIEFTEGLEKSMQGAPAMPSDAPLLKYLKGTSSPIFRHDIDLNPLYASDRQALSDAFLAYSSEVMLPLRYKDRLRGVVSLGRKKSGKIFTHEDVDLLKTISSQGAVALENARLFEENLVKGRMEEELKIARDIQVSMLPDSAPEIEGFTIAATSIPAREVGGDFYDFIPFDVAGTGKRLAIVVGDVSGKAISGALVMAASRSVFRVLTESSATVEAVMNQANLRLKQDVKKGMFVATLYAVLDPGERTLTLSNAGQTQPVLCPGDGSAPVYLETEGDCFPLGIVEDCRYEASRVFLKGSDVVVLYTDGVVEAVNASGEMYGFDRFLAAIGEGRSLPSEALLSGLVHEVERFVGGVEQHDDITIVIVKVEEQAEIRV